MMSAIVWTLNALTLSRKFYEREGGELVKTGVWHIDGAALPEVAYGWRQLRYLGRDHLGWRQKMHPLVSSPRKRGSR